MKKVYIFILLVFVVGVLTGFFIAKINISKKEPIVKAKEEKEIIDVQYLQFKNSSWVEGEIKSRNPLQIETKVSSEVDMTKNGNIYITKIKLYYTNPLLILKDHEGYYHFFNASQYTKRKSK